MYCLESHEDGSVGNFPTALEKAIHDTTIGVEDVGGKQSQERQRSENCAKGPDLVIIIREPLRREVSNGDTHELAGHDIDDDRHGVREMENDSRLKRLSWRGDRQVALHYAPLSMRRVISGRIPPWRYCSSSRALSVRMIAWKAIAVP